MQLQLANRIQRLQVKKVKEGSEMDTEVSHSKSEAPAKPKQRFGSRPFNVLMTPSDKKRMMDSKRA